MAGLRLKSVRRSCNAGGSWSDGKTWKLTFKVPLQTDKNANVEGIDFYQRRFAVTIV